MFSDGLQIKLKKIIVYACILFCTLLVPLYICCLIKPTIVTHSLTNIFRQSFGEYNYLHFNNVKMLKSAPIKVGQHVKTLGYYYPGDEGGNSFIISDKNCIPNNGTIIQLNNGLFAIAINDSSTSIKQFGAVGDGIVDDCNAFQDAFNSGLSSLHINSGTYNFNHSNVNLPQNMTIIGHSPEDTILQDVCIVAPYGISMSDITLRGGSYNKIQLSGRSIYEGNFLAIVTPIGSTTVSYTNCHFENADYGSFAMENKNNSPNCFLSDAAINCSLSNITYIAIYHCIDSTESSYSNNIFTNIGSSNINKGVLGALKIGDTTNLFEISSKNAIICDNTFINLYSADDYSGSRHEIACNFITVKADKVLISNNYLENLSGFGNDREAIYTKAVNCEISGNEIIDGGCGEGYITNKSTSSPNSYAKILDNTIHGSHGVGIRNYGAAEIRNNTISITCANGGIICHGLDVFSSNVLLIKNNTINCTIGPDPYPNKAKYFLQVENASFETLITDNTLHCNSSQIMPDAILRIGSVINNFTISNNIIESKTESCPAIQVSAKDTLEQSNLSLVANIIGNNICNNGQDVAIIIKGSSPSASRTFNIQNNTFENKINTQNYSTTIYSSTQNNDTLNYTNNQSSKAQKVLTTTKNINADSKASIVHNY